MKYVAASLILPAIVLLFAGVQGALRSRSIAGQVGAFVPVALAVWMAIRVTREYNQTH